MTTRTPVLHISSLHDPFRDDVVAQLEALLPDFIASRRWFRAKARTIRKAVIEDVLPISEQQSYVFVIRLNYAEGGSDEYVLPVTIARRHVDAGTVTAYQTEGGSEGDIHDALADEGFRELLVDVIACEKRVSGRKGDLIALRASALQEECGAASLKLESFVSRAEQSNTSIIYGDRFILKLFRKIESGINPDIEIGTFLTEHGFRNTPAVLGHVEYRKGDGTVYALAILQQFVRNQGDAWKYTLESLNGFFERARLREKPAPPLENHHPFALLSATMTSDIKELLGAYADSVRLLGVRTAEMHRALADPRGGPDFAPEPFTSVDGQNLYDEMLQANDIASEFLRRKQATLAGTAAEDAQRLLRAEHRIAQLFSPLRDCPISAARIRFHGDYHLGQVLYTGSDFMIIDFEGEPARPLNERRGKTLAMRDVAGMIRSFQYAAYSVLFGLNDRSAMQAWADFWTAWTSAEYLKGYFSAAEEAVFLPATTKERHLLLDVFLLHKALYEVGYELNNRPDWISIPLRGILGLVN